LVIDLVADAIQKGLGGIVGPDFFYCIVDGLSGLCGEALDGEKEVGACWF
jgi:hypothetical protein